MVSSRPFLEPRLQVSSVAGPLTCSQPPKEASQPGLSQPSGHCAGAPRPADSQHLLFPGEASASTMWDNNAWTLFYDNSSDGEPPFLTQDFIHAFQPDAKLIVMLRDPVER